MRPGTRRLWRPCSGKRLPVKLLFRIFLFAVIILLLYATTLTDPHTFVFWNAFVQSKAFFWSLIGILTIGGILAILRFRHALSIKKKNQQADKLLSKAQATADAQKDTLNDLKQQLKNSYHQKEVELQADYDRLKAPYQKKINDLKKQNLALKETVAKLMKALKERQSHRQ